MQLALALILARTVARTIQLSGGLASGPSQSHTYTLVLDGALVLAAAIIVTVSPPGPAFGRAWDPTSPSKKKARRHNHLAHLYHPSQRSPGSPLLNMRPSPAASPNEPRFGYYNANNSNNNKEPRSPPPLVTTDAAGSMGQSGLCGSGRYSHRRQAPAAQAMGENAPEPPPYERPLSNITRVPFVPPRALTLSQQYGSGQIVESEVTVAHGGDGTRTGGSAGSGGGPGGRARTRSSPRGGDVMVRHDSIW